MGKRVDAPGRASAGEKTATFLSRRGHVTEGAWCPCTCVVWQWGGHVRDTQLPTPGQHLGVARSKQGSEHCCELQGLGFSP